MAGANDPECEAKFDAIVGLVEAGATIREAVPRVSNAINFDVFRKWAKRRPERQARLKAASSTRDAGPNSVLKRPTRKKPPPQAAPGRDAVFASFDAIITLIEAGAQVQDAAACVGYHNFTRWVRRTPALRDRLDRATAAVRARSTFSDANYSRALTEMVAWDAPLEKARFAGISYGAVVERAESRPEYRRQYEAALAARSARRGIWLTDEERQAREQRRRDWYAKRDRIRAAYVPPATPLTKDQLLRPLFENELYRKANAFTRRSDNDADDLRSDAILAILEGRETNRQDLLRRHSQVMETYSIRSFDDRLTLDSDTAFIDTITTNDMVWGI